MTDTSQDLIDAVAAAQHAQNVAASVLDLPRGIALRLPDMARGTQRKFYHMTHPAAHHVFTSTVETWVLSQWQAASAAEVAA